MRRLFCILAALSLALSLPKTALGVGNGSEDNFWYYSDVYNTGKDDGYVYDNSIKEDDPHYGWKLGRFVISGFTEKKEGETPIFLKNVGDEVKLTFELQQDLNALDGDESKRVIVDKKGYDEHFQVKKTNFGRGALIVRQTDYQNDSPEPQLFTNYLKGVEKGSETKVQLFEEGDYEVALNYTIESPGFALWSKQTDYHIHFKFKVRNSNTMAFLFDNETGDELFNGQVTPNGFRIDTAGSHYLEINVKKEILNEARDGLVEDTRFNRSATDGSQFTDSGIYTVTIRNPSTNEEPTTKVIYVGDDDLLKASVANGMSVLEVQKKLDEGATVAEDGTLVQASSTSESQVESASDSDSSNQVEGSTPKKSIFAVRPIFIALLILAIIFAIFRARKGGEKK